MSEAIERALDAIKFGADGLVAAVAQQHDTGEVLMLAWMNRDAYEETVRTRRACYFSRSRNRLWRKGEESGHVQEVHGIYIDCDADTILLKVHQVGGAAYAFGRTGLLLVPLPPSTLAKGRNLRAGAEAARAAAGLRR